MGDDDADADEHRYVRQAVVIVHGMGEQRPLDTLNGFIAAALPHERGEPPFYFSRPDKVTDSYEARRYLAPAQEGAYAQTEFYEYHWSHRMSGNKIGDLIPVLRRLLLRPFWQVPSGLRFAWFVIWGALAAIVWAWGWGPLSDVEISEDWLLDLLAAAFSTGLVGIAVTYLVTRFIPSRLTTSFVDVVRYLDTSPRSYAVRRDIRWGMLDLLQGLHDSGRYQRVVVVAHSLGSYIAYDALTFLWARMNKAHDGTDRDCVAIPELDEVERLAGVLTTGSADAGAVRRFEHAQRDLWLALRGQGNPWLVTDFVSIGSPMYFADLLYTANRRAFMARRDAWELAACPPVSDAAVGATPAKPSYGWCNKGTRVLFHGAPFAVARWTNLWFPSRLGVFGDWFGGALAPLFGSGVRDVPLRLSRIGRVIPAVAHARYFKYPHHLGPGNPSRVLRDVLDLDASVWLEPTLDAPEPDPETL